VCFYVFPRTLFLVDAVFKKINSLVNIEILDSENIQTANGLTEIKSSRLFGYML
jgi:hypothetical protein